MIQKTPMINSCIRPAFVALVLFTILSVSNASVAPLSEVSDKRAVSLPSQTKQTDLVTAAITQEKSNKQLAAFLLDFSKRCSAISKLTTFGKSVNGFPLYSLEISDKPGQVEAEPNLKIIANIHGDETLGRTLVVGLAEWLCQNYQTDAVAKRVVDGVHLFLVPTLNPDGFDDVNRGNARGVDLNRDFPDRFDDPTCAPTGKEQPEVKAMMAWSEAKKFAASISYHGGALVVNYPWDGTKNGSYYNNPSPDDATFKYISLAYANAHGKMTDSYNSEFPTGITNGAQWYTIYGGMQDWNYVRTGCMEVTIEVGYQKMPADIELQSDFDNNLPAMLEFIQKAGLAG